MAHLPRKAAGDEHIKIYAYAIQEGKSHSEASELAGYQNRMTTRMNESGRMSAATQAAALARLINVGVPAALAAVIAAADGSKEISKTRLTAALAILDRAEIRVPKTGGKPSEADLAGMSRDELEAFIKAAQDRVADQAKPVKAQETEPEDVQDIDMFK